ncbi:uncharacterized protein EV420DRAFT_1639595 [Desarmillaria tabescens]|uniref:Uncharacterized protein n=1 Tax=Armillaria tabescens TaxID=1929756 RepID=A0AA39NB51_ARMTA|nr:uncharacterized protein EV420DRAFT_1639595 [Desarmillaria tabescens]KAK0462378.1 hypothetical protein EV420DRAFT_1639595 [Desarmillaria tabescens]
MPRYGGSFRERQWTPQAPWSVGEYCWYQFAQNGRPVIVRYRCLVAHISATNSPPWSSPQLWSQV